ncbi:epoxide hydrolase 1-like [Diorhabda carinulata]|nr:epoxide hydrolase 1-like [Diorhabda carinulata]
MDIILFHYWFPKKATTAARYYCENSSIEGLLSGLHNIPIDTSVPCGCAFFEDEFIYQPESFLRDKYPNLIQYNTYPAVGHFAAIEANDVLTKDIILFVNKLYESNLL